MILRKHIVALALGALASTVVFTPDVLAHERLVIIHHGSHVHITEHFRGSTKRTTPQSTSSELPTTDLVLTQATTLTNNTKLPAGTVLPAQTNLPIGTELSNGTILIAPVTLQGPVKLKNEIILPAGAVLQANTALPTDTVLPGIPSISRL